MWQALCWSFAYFNAFFKKMPHKCYHKVLFLSLSTKFQEGSLGILSKREAREAQSRMCVWVQDQWELLLCSLESSGTLTEGDHALHFVYCLQICQYPPSPPFLKIQADYSFPFKSKTQKKKTLTDSLRSITCNVISRHSCQLFCLSSILL